MHSDTLAVESTSAYGRYVSDTAPTLPNAHRPSVAGNLVRHCTAALTLISALTVTMPGTATAGIPSAASTQLSAPIVIWRRSKAALSQAEIDALMAKLDRLKRYRPGWAGPGSVVPTPRALVLAGDFVHYLSEAGLPVPNRVNLSSDGEINFYWKRSNLVFDFGIDRRCRASFYAKLPNGSEIFQDAKRGLPRLGRELVEALG